MQKAEKKGRSSWEEWIEDRWARSGACTLGRREGVKETEDGAIGNKDEWWEGGTNNEPPSSAGNRTDDLVQMRDPPSRD